MASRKQVKKRSASIRKYAKKNPDILQESLAKVFKVSQSTVSRALEEKK